MFRKRRTIINGVELPEEFSGAAIVNNVAISDDGKRYAYVTPQGGIVTGDMPKDGRLNVGGTEIQYKKGNFEGINLSGPGVRIVQSGYGSMVVSTGRGVSVSQMCVGGGGVSQISIGGSGLEYQIDKSYDSVRKVVLQQLSGGIELDLSDDGKTYVQGFTGAEPRYDNGRLVVDGLDGVLKLPKSSTELEVDISTT